MDATGTLEPGEIRHHLPIDEKTTGNNKRKGPIHRTQHGKNSIPFHSGEDVDVIKHYNTDHRHPESTSKLDKIPTSTGHYSRSNC